MRRDEIDFFDALEQRFWAKVPHRPEDPASCWEWSAAVNPGGYGVVMVGRRGKYRATQAHRISYILAYGQATDGMDICHTCDNRRCVRPSHLWEGTRKDNLQDMARKGRRAGERSPLAKLTLVQVHEIRDRYTHGDGYKRLGRAYGVTQWAIREIIKGENWARF